MSGSRLERVHGWCPMCRSRCGCISVVSDGRLLAVEPDPQHPTGAALCAKGRAAPELVYSEDRILQPLRRTRPKGDADPGWEPVSWDEALDETAAQMRRLAAADGPRAVAFAITTPSGTSISDSIAFVERLMRAWGSPNNCYGTEICNWHKDVATRFTYGASIGTPDLDNAGCVLLWGHNPNHAWLAQATRVARARARGAALVVVDPRRVGPAAKADVWLRVRPGTDAALALGLMHLMLENGWYDDAFLRTWTNAPGLVDTATGEPLRAARAAGAEGAWLGYGTDGHVRALEHGDGDVELRSGADRAAGLADGARTVFEQLCERAAGFPPERVAALTGVAPASLAAAAELLWTARPLGYYAWSGVGQHTNATQTDRAIACLCTLTGSYGERGGNMPLTSAASADVSGLEFVTETTRAQTLGVDARPLGPPRDGWCTSRDLYRAILEHTPYAVRGLLAFGANPLMSHANAARGTAALEALEFHAHADLFMTPTARFADIFLPVNTGWEREALRIGFDTSQHANGRVQLRPAAVASLGESRDDAAIAFALAERLGLGAQFWDGDRDAAYREWLAPSGLTPEALRARPGGVQLSLAAPEGAYREHGFGTPSGRIELWSESLRGIGHDALPVWVSPAAPDSRYPLVLTSAKSHLFCHGQHRNLPSLRRRQRDPTVELHPDTAAARSIAHGDWVSVRTPRGAFRARARTVTALAPDTVVAQHGWWQHCAALDLPGYPALGTGSANMNAAMDDADPDPVSGSVALRAYVCDVERAD